MRVLKRDLPLTILVDILVQVVFVLSVVFALEILVGDDESGVVDPKPLYAQIELLKAKIASLEEEAKQLKETVGQAEAAGFLRAGKRDCFNPPNVGVLRVTWGVNGELTVEPGEVYAAFRAADPRAESLLGVIRPGEKVADRFALVSEYSTLHDCLMTVRFFYPDGTPKRQWMESWSAVRKVFGRGWFAPE